MTQVDQSADGKGEVQPAAGKNEKLEDKVADEKDTELVSDGPVEERKRASGR